MKRVHVIVSGWVQGVFFRARTQREAEALGVRGWVRNLTDGSVEAVFEGTKEAVDTMLAWCRKGPSQARVDDVTITEEPYQGLFKDFLIK